MVDTLLISSVLLGVELKIFFLFFSFKFEDFFSFFLGKFTILHDHSFNCQIDIPIQFIIIMTIPIPIILIPIPILLKNYMML